MTTTPSSSEGGGSGSRGSYWGEVKDSARLFFALPPQLLVVLVLEFLNSFRHYGMRFVIYTYITNEYHLSDEDAGLLLGAKGMIDIFFGLAGSILVDLIGVRRTSIFSLSVAVVGRSLLAFGRSRSALFASALCFGPMGESLLGTGLYRVALKKLTTPRTRPVAFAVAYAVRNMAGAVADVLIDVVRRGPDVAIGGRVFTPTRMFLVLTLVAVVVALVVAVLFLRNITVADVDDPEEDMVVPTDAVEARPMVEIFGKGSSGQYKVFPTAAESCMETEERAVINDSVRSACTWVVNSVHQTLQHIWDLLHCRNLWSVVVFGMASLFVAFQWSASEIALIPFLERTFGETVPIFTVHSINFWGCLLLPPVVGLLTAPLENFRVILPGLWFMALSPFAILLWPTIAGACLWQVCLTMGEVFWSPRVQSWTALLAPTGKEGIFFAMAASRELFVPMGDYVLGEMNKRYNPNCPDCRDQYGHFCAKSEIKNTGESVLYECISQEETCVNLPLMEYPGACPSTCQACPGWEPQAQVLWTTLLLVSIISPVLVWLLLPLFRGKHRFSEGFYGILQCGCGRVLGICGYEDVAGSVQGKSYERIDASGQVIGHSCSDITRSALSDDNSSVGDLEMT